MKHLGFTIVEILIVMALMAAVSGFGAVASTTLYQSFSFHGQRDLLVNLLRRARSQSISNINQAPHGVHVSPDGYVLYEGQAWDSRDPSRDENYSALPGVAVSGATDFIFSQLSGSAKNSGSINIQGAHGRSIIISINNEGQIN